MKTEVYQLRVYLRGISPVIWRRLLLSSKQTIADLHYTIQIAMGWEDIHLNRFIIRGKEYGVAHLGGTGFTDDPRKVKFADFRFRHHERFLYEYDFYDWWRHEIRLEKTLPFDPDKTYPHCLGGSRKAPPEDCGGASGFMAMESHYSLPYIADRMMTIIEEEYPRDYRTEVKGFMYWLSINQFDKQHVNHRLQQYANGDHAWREIVL
ncbi:MAG: plasmid pRiA4b ORF-3 family protein [Desulfobulbaceae bacterium]|nr:plasmid pRiA4b ORF-3 family protein [Desulfobulbaceae bacterium]